MQLAQIIVTSILSIILIGVTIKGVQIAKKHAKIQEKILKQQEETLKQEEQLQIDKWEISMHMHIFDANRETYLEEIKLIRYDNFIEENLKIDAIKKIFNKINKNKIDIHIKPIIKKWKDKNNGK